MNKIFITLCMCFTFLKINAQENIYILKDRSNNIVFKKEKVITLQNMIYEDYGDVLVKVYFLGDTVLKIESIKSNLNNNFIDYNSPIYGDIYRELVKFFKENVAVNYEKKTIYRMTFIFKYYIEKQNIIE